MPASSQFAPGRKGGCSLGILRPGCQVNVYMCTWSYLPPQPVVLCLADLTLTLVRAVRTPKHQSPSVGIALPPACRGTKPAGPRCLVTVGRDVRRITTTRELEESDNGSAHLRSPPPQPLTRAIGTYTVVVQAVQTVERTVINRRGRLQRVAEGCRVAQTHLNPIRQGILLHAAGSRSGCSERTIFTINRFAG